VVDDTQDRKSGGKSADAFRTISEVSEEVGVPQHVLRFWETKFPQIRPLKRGGGRRYYRPEDIDLLQSIRGFLYDDGYTIKGVQKLLGEGASKAGGQRVAERDATGKDSLSRDDHNIKRIRPRDTHDHENDRDEPEVSDRDEVRGDDRVSLDVLDDAVGLIEEPKRASADASRASDMDTVIFDPEDNSVIMSHDNQPDSAIADWDRGMIMSVVESLETLRDRLRKTPSGR
jgi:DNA-binding transcriptional MerR regulator